MPCFHPLKAFRDSSGVKVLHASAQMFNLRLPCGQCVGCRLERSRQWAVRCLHEASLHEFNSFITLTYDDANLPQDGSLNHAHFQRFLKRLRSSLDTPVRYYMCGEYGGKLGRPHYHAIIFGYAFPDRQLWRASPSGSHLFRSPFLEKLWPFGFSSIGDVTFESAAYVARYVMKKVTGDLSARHYEFVSEETGEIMARTPEYNRMSLKPGIGAGWFDSFFNDVFPHDRVVVDGVETKPPRYYDKLLQRVDSGMFEEIKKLRVDNFSNFEDNTPERLAAREIVTNAQLSQLKRILL